MTIIKKYFILFVALVLTSIGISLTMIAAIGVSPFDALTQSISLSSGIRVGNVLIIIYILFILMQFLLLRREADWTILLQFPLTLVLGQLVNFFFYGLVGTLSIDSYLMNLFLFLFAQLLVAFSISIILLLDLISMPIEKFSLLLAERKNYPFGKVRQSFDLLFMMLSLLLTFIFSIPFTIREGTIIGSLIFGPQLAFFMKKLELPFKKMNLIH